MANDAWTKWMRLFRHVDFCDVRNRTFIFIFDPSIDWIICSNERFVIKYHRLDVILVFSKHFGGKFEFKFWPLETLKDFKIKCWMLWPNFFQSKIQIEHWLTVAWLFRESKNILQNPPTRGCVFGDFHLNLFHRKHFRFSFIAFFDE